MRGRGEGFGDNLPCVSEDLVRELDYTQIGELGFGK